MPKVPIETAMFSYRTFLFTLKAVSQATGRPFAPADYEAVWQTLHAVASGRVTLNASPAEITAGWPPEMTKAREAEEQAQQEIMRTERHLAKVLLAASFGGTA